MHGVGSVKWVGFTEINTYVKTWVIKYSIYIV